MTGRDAFVGREQQLAVLEACAVAAAGGDARVVWLEGDAGMGKSALTSRLVAALAGRFTVLRAAADEQLRDESYSTISQVGVAPAASSFAAGLVLLDRLNEIQATGPAALVVEDAHWADPASRAALLTTARRLQHDQVLMLLTTRPDPIDDDWARFSNDPELCVRLSLGGFDDAEVADLARRRGVELSGRQAARLRRHTGGHPLHVHTLLHELSASQLTSGTGELPAPRSLASATTAVLCALPADSQALAAALAVLAAPTPLAVAARVAGVTAPSEALEPLLHTGFVRWSPSAEQTPVELSHPLYRAAVYGDLPESRRRRLHLACAAVTSWGVSWSHRVAAADGPDDVLDGELAAGAEYEIARADLSLAATYLSWASRVASNRSRQEDHLLRSVRLLILDGQSTRADELAGRVAGARRTALRDLVVGMLAFARADPVAAERALSDAAAPETTADADRTHVAEALGQLGLLYTLQGRAADAVDVASRALALGPFADGRVDRNAWWGRSLGESMLHGAPRGLALLAQRLPPAAADVRGDDGELLVARGLLHLCAGDTAAAIVDLRAAFELARAGFGFAQLPRAQLTLARALFMSGSWDESLVQARTALSLMDDTRPWMRTQAESVMTLVLAARGDWEVARGYVDAAIAIAAQVRTFEATYTTRAGAAALAHARGDHASVVAALEPLATGDAGEVPETALLTLVAWWPMLVASLIELGELERASGHLERLGSAGMDAGLRLEAHSADLRGRLALARGDDAAAEASFEAALEAAAPDHPVLERSLLHHAYGRLLRRRGQRRRSEDQLRLAHGLLDRLGAAPYCQRVEDDLRESGSAARPRRSRQPFTLTSRELDVAALVKNGLTNREVAAELYISTKAVEYHLRNVYAKLSISSRRELRDMDI